MKILNFFTEPPKVYFQDVRESYFNTYRQYIDDFFRASDKEICNYVDTHPQSLYRTPYYKDNDPNKPDLETRKFYFSSKGDFTHCKKIINNLGRNMIQVRIK